MKPKEKKNPLNTFAICCCEFHNCNQSYPFCYIMLSPPNPSFTPSVTYLPSRRSIRGLRTISDSCCIVVRWLGCDSDTCPAPFTFDNKAPNSCILCCIWGSSDLANILLSSSSTPLSFCCNSLRILAALASNCNYTRHLPLL